ncbi:MAG: MogA/MoaB family molybdenum cofactor biosynthesis protein [Chloroflexota bacterium]|nr:MogA/MoaB family molybdenum cofactor biosynthesis protein [Chloroflexota bacterium]
MTYGVAIVTVSDRQHAGERAHDASAQTIRESLAHLLHLEVVEYAVRPDEREVVEATLRELASREDIQLILTTGGTGLAPRDVTPDATLRVIEYQVPGIAEAIRQEGLRHTPMAMLSRAVAGVVSGTLVINLPGSPKGVRESLSPVLPALVHALDKLTGDPSECGPNPETSRPTG